MSKIRPDCPNLERMHVFKEVEREEPKIFETDKLAAVRSEWDKWVRLLPLLNSHEPDVTVNDSRLCCPTNTA